MAVMMCPHFLHFLMDPSTQSFRLYAIDVTSAVLSALAVAPFIAIVDQAVTEKTADAGLNIYKAAFANFKSLVFTPIKFFSKPTLWFVCLVYSSTYIAANTITTYCELNDINPEMPKLFGTTATNMGVGILKDRYFAKVFNKKAPPVFPLVSWGLFVVRDLLTIGAAFNFPKPFAKFLQDQNIITNPQWADTFAQYAVPMTAQLFLTPIHLLSLDFYNRVGVSAQSRFSYIKSIYPDNTSMRVGRVLCAYGIAGESNKSLKKTLRAEYAT